MEALPLALLLLDLQILMASRVMGQARKKRTKVHRSGCLSCFQLLLHRLFTSTDLVTAKHDPRSSLTRTLSTHVQRWWDFAGDAFAPPTAGEGTGAAPAVLMTNGAAC